MRILCLILLCLTSIYGSTQEFHKFEITHQVETTPLKDQQSSGTCWSFATTSFIETEAIRLGQKAVSLSPIYYVHPTYITKAQRFIETEGETYFDAGDLSFSVLDGYRKYGAIPESVYDGIIDGDWQHDHLEMDELLYAMVSSVGTSGYGRIKPNSWKTSVQAVLQSYLGIPPATFLYEGKLYSPQSYAREHIGINPDDYVEITSYSHQPFYMKIDLDIPANYNDQLYLNLPIEEFKKVIDHAIEQGFSLAWDGDATEPDFDFSIGIAKLTTQQESTGIDQTLRQETFEDETTTDDHNMHIIGKATDANGRHYYLFKNSEGSNDMGGYIYMSENAVLLKTISILVHQDAIPQDIRQKCE